MSTFDLAVNTVKGLAIDAIQAANSGHPGLPMGMADVATLLWSRYLRFDPRDPTWPDRDRFVLSAGHGSALLYALLHLTGYPDVPMSQLKAFRQWGSRTAGHPEHGFLAGIETTTGPLGQGFGTAVGMALAERMMAARFPGLADHRTWVIAGDGDLMEGISSESAALAGHWGLGRLIVFWDDNGITIDGTTAIAWSEDVRGRFEACGWHTTACDGYDPEAIAAAIESGLAETARPTLIACKTHIGHGSPNKQDTSAAHGSPLGEAEIALVKAAMGFPSQPFYVPAEARAFFEEAAARGGEAQQRWTQAKAAANPALVEAFDAFLQGDIDPTVWRSLPDFPIGQKVATRKSSGAVLNAICDAIPQLQGGSADLAGSNGTDLKAYGHVARDAFGPDRRNIHYGIREHGMGVVMNGLALHGGFRPFGGTFLVFSDYMRPAVRLAALMDQPVTYVWTHDSVFLGEDGPTHQPIEHAMSLRLIPNLAVVRPGDAHETVGAWRLALENRDGPTALLLTRQGLPTLASTRADGVLKGGYIVWGSPSETPDIILLATGSELHLATEAAAILTGVTVRVVSLPCWSRFEEQDAAYRESVLPAACRARISIEAGITAGWERYVGTDGEVFGIDHFGVSAPADIIAREWGFTPQAFAERVRAYLADRSADATAPR